MLIQLLRRERIESNWSWAKDREELHAHLFSGKKRTEQKSVLLARGESDTEKNIIAKPQTTHSAVICRPIGKYVALLIRDSTGGAFDAIVTMIRWGSTYYDCGRLSLAREDRTQEERKKNTTVRKKVLFVCRIQ